MASHRDDDIMMFEIDKRLQKHKRMDKWRFYVLDVTDEGNPSLEFTSPQFEEGSDDMAKMHATKCLKELGYVRMTQWVATPNAAWRICDDDTLVKLTRDSKPTRP